MSERNSEIEDELELKTGSKLATEYLYSECGATISENTAKNYQSYLRGYIEHLDEGSVEVLTAKSQNVRSYLKKRARHGKRESTLRLDLTVIKGLYKWIRLETEKEAQIDYLHLENINIGRFRTTPAIKREPLNKDELEDLYDELDTFRDRLMVTVGAELGPRNIDLRKIRVGDIDFENRTIDLSDTKGSDRYSLPISDELSVEFKHWLTVYRPTYLYSEDHDYVFPSEQGGHLSDSRLLAIVKEAARNAGIQETLGESSMSKRQKDALGTDADVREWKKVTVHALRHTFSHLMEEAGLSPEVRRDALNHKSTETTEKYYSSDETEYKELIRELLHGERNNEDN
ncbi:tyrosine-type recombinase/integrase [Natrialba sp. PRR66]|uniref:tyrosine-type recombinase/integrase n=1 Tax=Natrialba sp. PRR66 TaxID=3098146 RepID=UPI002B1D1EA5|nr:tyrosine-type recombinase/integrase [Natrialba sp. PRR66]